MEFSEKGIGALSAALSQAQGSFLTVGFDSTNPFYKSRYASLSAIVEATRRALAENNLAIVQSASVHDQKLIVTTLISHSSGEWLKEAISIGIESDTIQQIGSKISYLKRYQISAMLSVVSDEDDDGETAEREKSEIIKKTARAMKETPAIPPKTQISSRVGRIRSIFNLSAKLGQTPKQMLQVIGELIGVPNGIRESSDIPDDKLDIIVEAFSSQLEALQNQAERKAA